MYVYLYAAELEYAKFSALCRAAGASMKYKIKRLVRWLMRGIYLEPESILSVLAVQGYKKLRPAIEPTCFPVSSCPPTFSRAPYPLPP